MQAATTTTAATARTTIKRATSPSTAKTAAKMSTAAVGSVQPSVGNNVAGNKIKIGSHQSANNKGGNSTDSNDEIEEISKKISEHADAIYRTWKCHGIAPTELLEFYTGAADTNTAVAAGDFFGASKVVGDDASSLQSLVSTFVSKDKEQRGMKSSPSGISSTGVGSVGNTNGKIAQFKVGAPTATATTRGAGNANAEVAGATATTSVAVNKVTQKNAIAPQAATAAATATTAKGSKIVAPKTHTITTPIATTHQTATSKKRNSIEEKDAVVAEVDVLLGATPASTNTSKKSAKNSVLATTTTPATTNAKNVACVKNVSASETPQRKSGKLLYQREPKLTTGSVPDTVDNATAKTTNGKLMGGRPRSPHDVNFNLELDMGAELQHLDVNNLSLLQTENLKMIKELLKTDCVVNATAPKTRKPQMAAATPSKTEEAKVAMTGAAKTKTTVVIKTKSDNQNRNPTAATSSGAATSGNHNATSGGGIKRTSATKSSEPATGGVGANEVLATTGLPQIATTLSAQNTVSNTAANKVSDKSDTMPTATTTTTTAAINKSTRRSTSGNNNSNSKASREKSGGSVTERKSPSPTPIDSNNTDALPIAMPTTTTTASATNEATTAPTTAAASNSSGNTSAVVMLARSNMPAPTKSPAPATSGKSSARTAAAAAAAAALGNGDDKYLGRPILTRGSVAERVMLFEKCPDARNSFLNIKRPDPADAPPKSLAKAKLHATPPQPQSEHNSLQREIRTTKSVYIPRFYFPHGKPQPNIALERVLRGILSAFDSFPNNQVTKDELPRILKLCGLPFYWRMPVMVFCQQGNSGLVERQRFVEFWKQMNVYCHEAASRFVYILSRGQRFRAYILPEDLAPLVQDVVDTHPGLAFLKEATEFHSRYVHTVIARIFYAVNRSWSGRISIAELKKSDLLEIITMLEEEDDINQIMAFFSYEHFYVIYCKFWELDKDHDLLISQDDLARHSDHALSTRIIERIFSGCVTRSHNKKKPEDEAKMSYTDFVWFLLSEEDKRSPTAIEYWFRCMDIDGDGALSMYELEYFYEEQQQRMESIGIETLPFEDCLCQMLDMIKPQRRDCVTLGDLKRCKMTHVFFDTFFNLEKYLDHEQRDPFASQRDEYPSDWDRFAAQEYELLITEEND